MQDLRLAFRALRSTPIVTAVAILSLALGIGANTAIFSLVNSLLLRTLPVREPSRLVLISDSSSSGAQYWRYQVWEQIQQRPDLFEAVGAWSLMRVNLATEGETQFVDGMWVSGSYFEALGLHAALGRVISIGDDRPGGGTGGPVMMISDGFWQRRFGRAPDIIGRQLPVNGVPVSIIGVTPPSFFGTDIGRTFDVILPIGDEPLIHGRDSSIVNDVFNVMIIGRLKAEQTREGVTAALRAAQPQIREATRPRNRNSEAGDPYLRDYLTNPFTLTPAAIGNSGFGRRYIQPLVTIMSAAGLVLLVACANVANILLARASGRRHELSVRVALGASRWRLVRQLLAESILLAGVATVSALMVTSWASRLLVRQLSTQTNPVFLDLSIDWRLLTFAVTVAVATVLIAGVVPALRASGVAPMDALKEHGRGTVGHARIGLPGALVVVQIALSVVLVVAAGLFVRSFTSLVRRDPGFARDEVLLVRIDGQRAIADAIQRIAVYERVREAVRTLPGVADAALSALTPVSNVAFDPPIDVSGGEPLPVRERRVFGNLISPGWFKTVGIPLIAGRDITASDGFGTAPIAVVNQAFARKFLKGASPLDHSVTLPELMTRPGPNVPLRIVGVVADSVYISLRELPQATMYIPIGQHDEPFFLRTSGSVNLVVRSSSGSPARLARSVAAAIGNVNPQLALTFRPLADQLYDSLARDRVVAMLAGFFGVLALLLAGLGLYGVTVYAVSRRRTEIGIRLALGAAPANVVRLVLLRVSLLVALGVVVGTVVSLSTTTLAASLLYGLDPRDPTTLIGAATMLATVGMFAGWLPAWRASRIDPATVLREG